MENKTAKTNPPHDFFIPVMGTGFTLDTPLKVAKYGISSVISLVDDVLIEQLRKYWCKKFAKPYQAITAQDQDSRAMRITAYLNLLQKLIKEQIIKLKKAPFAPDSEITDYYAMLPEGDLKQTYQKMLTTKDAKLKARLQEELREKITAGNIEVNIMTKLDRQHYYQGKALPYETSDAAAALRGFAESDLSSTVVFSAGFNPHLYGYAAKFADFFPDNQGKLKKKICLKVSDYRSAAIQGKYLAKRGLWVSEYRIESPLNCGGHAFINDGQLLGPILEEFKQRKNELIETLHGFYQSALQSMRKLCPNKPQKVAITAQGGIGAYEEHNFLINYYDLTATGWGTPFLLVPEATNVDEAQLEKLLAATDEDVYLSDSSPLGVPYWNLRTAASEEARRERIKKGCPGSFCYKGFARWNTEFTKEPLCPAAREYQKYKLEELAKSPLPKAQLTAQKESVLNKSCICHDLGGGATLKYGIDKKATPAICPGPNILNFKKLYTLREMVDHIYGRASLIMNNKRVHLFIREIQLQINHLLNEIKAASLGLPARSQTKLTEVKENLLQGIAYYKRIAKDLLKEQQTAFLDALQTLQKEIENITLSDAIQVST